MSINRFRPEIWSAQLLVALRKKLVYGGPMVVNRSYEGDIKEAGDTVRITSISDPQINDYVPNVTQITFPELTDAQRTLVIDQCKYWAFGVDDVDARQAKGNVMSEAASRAAYKLADQMDQFIASLWTGVVAGNDLGSIAISASTAPTDAYDKVLVPLGIALDNASVPAEGRYFVATPELHGCFLRDGRFIKVSEAGTDEALRNGFVGRIGGFNISKSLNAPTTAGAERVCQAGIPDAVSFAEQINKTEALRPQNSFSDALKGLGLYGGKLVRPDCIAVARVTVNA